MTDAEHWAQSVVLFRNYAAVGGRYKERERSDELLVNEAPQLQFGWKLRRDEMRCDGQNMREFHFNGTYGDRIIEKFGHGLRLIRVLKDTNDT